MTPVEEVFSRRGGVKLLLMEVEQLRGALSTALDKLKLPVCSSPHAVPGGTRQDDLHASTGSRTKEVWAEEDNWAHDSPSTVVEATATPEIVTVSDTSTPARVRTLNPEQDHVLTRARRTDANAPALEAGADTSADDVGGGGFKTDAPSQPAPAVELDPPAPGSLPPKRATRGKERAEPEAANIYLQRATSGTHASVAGSSRRVTAGRASLKRGSLQDLRKEGEAGGWSNWASAANLSERELGSVRTMPKAAAVQRGSLRSFVDHHTTGVVVARAEHAAAQKEACASQINKATTSMGGCVTRERHPPGHWRTCGQGPRGKATR